MCGILFVHSNHLNKDDTVIEFEENSTKSFDFFKNDLCFVNKIMELIQLRGPNYSSLRCLNKHFAWYSSVLSLRQPFVKQSWVIGGKYVLQFNGELYNDKCLKNSDTSFIIQGLEICKNEAQLIQFIKSWDGEFAFSITDLEENITYFGRDSIGKRSLSYFQDSTGELYIASITGKLTDDENKSELIFKNCLAGIIYKYDFDKNQLFDDTLIHEPFQVTGMEDANMINMETYVSTLFEKLSHSISIRISSIHPKHIENSPISILFSGGLDCSVIVAMVCRQLLHSSTAVIELLNVSFENPRTGMKPSDSPDRKLAISSYQYIQELFPTLNIKLIEVDVPYDEYLQYKPIVVDMMYPKDTEMDLSIAIAFYFASKGRGYATTTDSRVSYQRKGIVLFSGLGADELYGGYHKFANKSKEELQAELTKQINNIHDRNLNRDDKVIASNGVEVRYPFLDEDVINYSIGIPINYKINKFILRKLASDKLSLGTIAGEPKRAIQFGSKSAKMTKDGNKKGTDLLK